MGGFWYHDVADAQVPAEHNLRRGCPALLSQRGHGGCVQISSLAQWAVCLYRDPKSAGLCGQGGLLERRVKLNLVHGRDDRRRGEQGVQMLLQEVGYADGPCAFCGIDLLHGQPRVDEQCLGWDRPVNEIQVDHVNDERTPARLEGLRQSAMLPVAQFGGDEDFLARDSRGRDRGTHACLIAVGGGRIDVPVAGPQRVLHDALRLSFRDLEYAKAELGNGDPVVQRQVWDDRHANSNYLRERDHWSLGVAGGLVEGQPVPDLPRTSRPTFGVEPGSGSGQNGVMGQSAEFGQFLRVMRARMRPEAAGLPATTTRRRVPGFTP